MLPQVADARRFAPDLLADDDLARGNRQFVLWTVVSLLAPAARRSRHAVLAGRAERVLRAGLVRVAFLHHVTWSVNSICHMIGDRPFAARDESANFCPPAVLSFGESWHNLHHADPTCARHGVRRGQADTSARLIRVFERLGWATNVRWPDEQRLRRTSRT